MMSEQEELKYYDMLYDFTSVFVCLNDLALDGEAKKNIEKRVQRLIPAFTALCGSTAEKPKQSSEPPRKEPEELPSNFMQEENGWGVCPICRKKMLRLTKTTKLIDFPAYCKSCKAEHLVSWWNAEHKDIEYARYVNNEHKVDRRNIRSEGMKGTGVKNFSTTRTSATERVAIGL